MGVAEPLHRRDDSWDVRSTIARTEFLLARRPPRRDPITWYWDVLRLQTRDEWSAAGFGAGNDGKDFEYAFASMIFRQFAIGGGYVDAAAGKRRCTREAISESLASLRLDP
eukprot:scaffold842_cov227-Pinguiococcus_pyrenoidosus.AAC.14